MRTLMRAFAVVVVTLVCVDPALAQDSAIITTDGMKYLALAIAVVGAALGQSKVLTSALDSIGRNPGASGQMFLPWLLGVIFIEALFVLTWLISAGFIG